MKLEFDLSELTEFGDRLVSVDLDNVFKLITQKISKALLKRMKALTPVGETYDLIEGWNGNHFLVTEREDGYEVLIVNRDEKAIWVNNGHRVRNNKNGEYYQVKHRVQVRSPHQWQKPVNNWYVFGHFFVERGILQLKNTPEIESIIMRELRKWWDSV